jgi:hypothetical protein
MNIDFLTVIIRWGIYSQFERFRVASGSTISSIFARLGHRGASAIPVAEFACNLSLFCHEITPAEAIAFAKLCDRRNRQVLTAQDVSAAITSNLDSSLRSLLSEHSVFPSWLIARDDFQCYFAQWMPSDVRRHINLC